MSLFSLAVAPIVIVVVYIYIRDKYEKEPWNLLFLGLFFGACITAPIMIIEHELDTIMMGLELEKIWESAYMAFVTAATTEEFFKFLILYALVWQNRNFNEKFDGIVYAVFVSLGFALVENILYVFNPELGGIYTGVMRSLFAVPAHAIFGIMMGYYFAMSKYHPNRRGILLIKALLVPLIMHGIYDFILIYQSKYMLFMFIPFILYMWVSGFRKMKQMIQESPFKE